MPDQDHNLHNAIVPCFNTVMAREATHEDVEAAIDAVLAVLSSHPEAVLSLLGTVRKGWATDVSSGYADCVTFLGPEMTPGGKPAFVVSLAETAKY